MTEEDTTYTPFLHAVVGDASLREQDAVVWVVLSRWEYPTEGSEVCVEYIDYSRNECGYEACFPTEGEARAHAAVEFGLSDADWLDGAPWPRRTR